MNPETLQVFSRSSAVQRMSGEGFKWWYGEPVWPGIYRKKWRERVDAVLFYQSLLGSASMLRKLLAYDAPTEEWGDESTGRRIHYQDLTTIGGSTTTGWRGCYTICEMLIITICTCRDGIGNCGTIRM